MKTQPPAGVRRLALVTVVRERDCQRPASQTLALRIVDGLNVVFEFASRYERRVAHECGDTPPGAGRQILAVESAKTPHARARRSAGASSGNGGAATRQLGVFHRFQDAYRPTRTASSIRTVTGHPRRGGVAVWGSIRRVDELRRRETPPVRGPIGRGSYTIGRLGVHRGSVARIATKSVDWRSTAEPPHAATARSTKDGGLAKRSIQVRARFRGNWLIVSPCPRSSPSTRRRSDSSSFACCWTVAISMLVYPYSSTCVRSERTAGLGSGWSSMMNPKRRRASGGSFL